MLKHNIFNLSLVLLLFQQSMLPISKVDALIEVVKTSIERAERHDSKLDDKVLSIYGLTSNKIRHLLNNICSMPEARYLEIGVLEGATFTSALYKNEHIKAIAIDNWSYQPEARDKFLANVNNFIKGYDYIFYEHDAFTIDKANFKNKINIYFYDGYHFGDAQELAFTYFNSIFDDAFIAIVDDWDLESARSGTDNAFKKLGYKVHFEKVLPARFNRDLETWWCGLYVAVVTK